MRIKKIEVVGFKSFADREVIQLDQRITSVIGPNGCGKSNIVDAIRWCLGEQRPKHLRGSGMSDVIFGGSVARGPAGLAEVTITFDNTPQSRDPSPSDSAAPALDSSTDLSGTGDIRDQSPASSSSSSSSSSYLTFAEIAVTRRLFRDGTSEYLINKVPCRLRDITEMLLGTGVGSRGYSIIEQGQIGDIVTSKPETRRHVIDEAAGITKFKAQKKAAERKIDQTRQNLLRITDVLHELEARLSSLRRQAQKAARYKRYKDELRDLELWMATHRLLELDSTGRVLDERRSDLSEQVGALRNETSARETRIEAERLGLRELEVQLQTAQQQVYDFENRIGLIEQDRRFKQQEQQGLHASVEQAKAEISAVSRVIEGLRGDLGEVSEQQAELGGVESSNELVSAERLGREHDEAADLLRDRVAELEGHRAAHAKADARRAGLEAQVESGRDAQSDREARLAIVVAELESFEVAAASEAARSSEGESGLETARSVVDGLREQRVSLDRERSELRERLSSAEVEVETARKELMRARSRLQSLEEIQSRYRGCQSGVQVVMEHREELGETQLGAGAGASAVRGIMADFITAPAHLESAVGAMLGERLQGVVVDAPATGARGVALLKRKQEGRTTFLPALARTGDAGPSWAPPSSPPSAGHTATGGGIEVVDLSDVAITGGPPASSVPQIASIPSVAADSRVLGRLSDMVEVDPRVRGLADELLAGTLVVDDLRMALELWQSQREEIRSSRLTLVTLEGDRLEPNGVIVGGSSQALESALLQQKREIEELRTLVDVLQGELDTVRAKQQGLAERHREVEIARERSEAEILDAEKALLGAEQEQRASRDAVERIAARAEESRRQRENLESDLAARGAELDELGRELEALHQKQPELATLVHEGQREVEELETRRSELAGHLTEAKVALAAWQEQQNALLSTRRRIEAQLSSETQRSQRLAASAQQSRERIGVLGQEVVSMGEEHGRLLDSHRDATREKQGLVETHEAARLRVEELELSLRNLRRDLDEEREQLGEVELGLRELVLERDHLCNDVRDRFDVVLHEALIDHHDRPLAGASEQNRVRELKRILSRMGEVNLTAITEFEEVSERFEYLGAQKNDLESAIEQLQAAIDRINKTTRERFRETFHQVNEMFQKLFPRLFAGGRAELILTDPSDLLTTGVEIMAQPPGKNVSSLELLSGGEKALTAVSLIFGVFLIKSSPFCLLDEVDAPLDEANVGRFCDLVRELTERTQFIIITHNKRTMEIADRLYGVTMQQKGVSKLVSVNMRRTAEEVQYQA